MAVKPIRTFPDPILRVRSQEVQEWNEDLERLIRDLSETLYSVPGLGLAAIQIGVPLRVFVYDLDLQEQQGKPRLTVMINPEIVAQEGESREEEGCLSLPDYREVVPRAARILVRALDRKGKPFQVEAEGLHARLIQHEMDHLNGVLMIDHLSSLKRQLFRSWFRKRQRRVAAPG